MRKLGDELCALTHLGLHDDGHVPVDGMAFKMHTGNVLELRAGIGQGSKLVLHLTIEPVEHGIDRGTENVILAFEVEIDRSVGYSRACCNRTHRGSEVSVLRNYFDSRVQNALVLVSPTRESSRVRRLP